MGPRASAEGKKSGQWSVATRGESGLRPKLWANTRFASPPLRQRLPLSPQEEGQFRGADGGRDDGPTGEIAGQFRLQGRQHSGDDQLPVAEAPGQLVGLQGLVQALGREAAVDHGHVGGVPPGVHLQQEKGADGQGQQAGEHRQGEFAVAGDQDRGAGARVVELEEIRRERPGKLQGLHLGEDLLGPQGQVQGGAFAGGQVGAVLQTEGAFPEFGRQLGASRDPGAPAVLRGQIRGEVDPVDVEIGIKHGSPRWCKLPPA